MYIHDTDILSQTENRVVAVPQPQADLSQHRTAIIRETNLYIQAFVSLKEWADCTEDPCNYRMIVHEYRRPRSEVIRG